MTYSRFTNILLVAVFFGFAGSFSIAQNQESSEIQEKPCATQEMIDRFLQAHPHLAEEIRALEENAEVEYQGERATKIFPIVFHIMHTYSSNDFIPNEQVHNAVRILNEDFQKKNADTSLVVAAFKNIIGNANWEFRLARKDPDGNCTNGITRWFYPLTQDAGEETKDFAPAWPRNKYINVWVVKGLESNAGGYTYNPSTAQFAPAYDGIMIVNTQLGSGGTSFGTTFSRRTLSHEMGHFFNLRHTWGNTNTPGVASNCNSDDNVSDTPNTIGVANQSCNTSQVTCNSLDNVQNIMDYASCLIMFTNGQVTRMTNAANSSTAQRSSLSTASNLVATGTNDGYADTVCVPLSDFIAQPRTICEGGTLSLLDFSWRGTPQNWQYTLVSGPHSVTANGPNPQVTLPNAGKYDVTLLTSNAAGQNSRTKTQYVAVFPNTATYSASNYFDDFENNPLGSGGWFVMNDDETNGWNETTSASVSGSKSLFVRNGSAIKFSKYSLVSPSYDLSQTTNPYLKFKYAFAKKADDNSDFFKIYISTNCGATWNLLPPGINAASATASTAPNTSGNFVPTASQWKEYSAKIPNSYASATNVRFRFELSNGGGNNFYLDDLNIGDQNASAQEILEQDHAFSLYPNPAQDKVFLTLDQVWGAVRVQVGDAAGRIVLQKTLRADGYLNAEVDLLGLKSGLFFLNLQLPGGLTHSEKLLLSR